MMWVVMLTAQVGIIGGALYLFFGDPTLLDGVRDISLIWLVALPVISMSFAGYWFKKKMPEVRQAGDLETRLGKFRKVLVVCWALLFAGALEAGAAAVLSGEWLLLAINVMIWVYFYTIRTSPIRIPKQLQFSKPDLVALQALYQKY